MLSLLDLSIPPVVLMVDSEYQRKRSDFAKFLALNELCFGCKLSVLLNAPVGRMAQYLIFLGTVHDKLDESSPQRAELEKAVMSIQAVTDDIAVSLRDSASRRLVVTIQDKVFDNNCDLLDPTRFVIKHADMQLVATKTFGKGIRLKRTVMVLFNDCLVYGSRAGKVNSAHVKAAIRLPGLGVDDMPDTVSSIHPSIHPYPLDIS
jgi:hypothetical protein